MSFKKRKAEDTELTSNTSLDATPGLFGLMTQPAIQSSPENMQILPESKPNLDSKFEVELSTTTEKTEDETIELSIPRTKASIEYCFLCNENKNLLDVPDDARIHVYINRKIYIPLQNRCCIKHLIKNRFYEKDMNALKIVSNTSILTKTIINKLFPCETPECTTPAFKSIRQFSDSEIKILTGLDYDSITMLSKMMKSMRDTEERSILEAIFVFLVKLRTGNSNNLIKTILKLEREQMVSEYSTSVLEAFEKDILPFHFDINSNNREDLIRNHTTDIAKTLYDAPNSLILICDGNYARYQKSTDNDYLRKSVSDQKKLQLYKTFTVCTTNGYIVDMFGPYFANENDASIMKKIMEDPNGLCKLMQPGDIFVLDRDFRDVVPFLEDKGYKVIMPALKGNQKQLTTKQSNESRFITKIRCAVETVHGTLKKKICFLDYILDDKMPQKIKSYYRVSSFLLNKFGKRLTLDIDIKADIVFQMTNKIRDDNTLATVVKKNGWLRKKLPFQSLTSKDVLDFPELTEEDLKIFFIGSYQYMQAISYLAEMIDDTGAIRIQFVKEKSKILKVQVKSRHISKKMYRCFVEYIPNSIGAYGISRFYCECVNGMRTMGCCSHLAPVIYYLSYARYLSKIIRPSEILSNLFKNGETIVTIEDDSDED